MHFCTRAAGILLIGILATSASADPQSIVVHNQSTENSTVKVTSGPLAGTCVGDSLFTVPGEVKKIAWNKIQILCGTQYPCTAEVYVGFKHDCGSTDVKIGDVAIDENSNITVSNLLNGHGLQGGLAELTIFK